MRVASVCQPIRGERTSFFQRIKGTAFWGTAFQLSDDKRQGGSRILRASGLVHDQLALDLLLQRMEPNEGIVVGGSLQIGGIVTEESIECGD